VFHSFPAERASFVFDKPDEGAVADADRRKGEQGYDRLAQVA
jgi:hypothetical protein